jgi:hypothetical protein
MDYLLDWTCEDLQKTFSIDDAFERDWSKEEEISPTFAKAFAGRGK